MNMGLALWLIFEFVYFLYFVFLKFWVRIFLFCIFEIFGSYFFCALYFLKNCIRIYFVFFLYFVCTF